MDAIDAPLGDRSLLDTNARLSVVVRDLDVKYRVYEEQRLSVRELVGKGFRGRRSVEIHALKSVSFDAFVGEAVGVLGANGSGKSTLLRAIAGLQSKTGGSVLVRGEPHLLGVTRHSSRVCRAIETCCSGAWRWVSAAPRSRTGWTK